MSVESNEIQLTVAAAEAAKSMQSQNADYTGKTLRLYLDGKGCDGFFYGVCFDQPAENDHRFVSKDTQILVDPDTIEFVDGSTIDWVDDERGRGFIVQNPNHRKFRGKFYKRTAWQQKLESKIKAKNPLPPATD